MGLIWCAGLSPNTQGRWGQQDPTLDAQPIRAEALTSLLRLPPHPQRSTTLLLGTSWLGFLSRVSVTSNSGAITCDLVVWWSLILGFCHLDLSPRSVPRMIYLEKMSRQAWSPCQVSRCPSGFLVAGLGQVLYGLEA